jgi:hypothetical protein
VNLGQGGARHEEQPGSRGKHVQLSKLHMGDAPRDRVPAAAEPRRSARGGLTPRWLDMLREAAARPTGGVFPRGSRAVTGRDFEALERLGLAASIDDCGHVHPGDGWTAADEPHGGHPHFFRITGAGREEVLRAGGETQQPREKTEELGLE